MNEYEQDILNSSTLVFSMEQELKKSNYDLKASSLMDWWKFASYDQKREILEQIKEKMFVDRCKINLFLSHK